MFNLWLLSTFTFVPSNPINVSKNLCIGNQLEINRNQLQNFNVFELFSKKKSSPEKFLSFESSSDQFFCWRREWRWSINFLNSLNNFVSKQDGKSAWCNIFKPDILYVLHHVLQFRFWITKMKPFFFIDASINM